MSPIPKPPLDTLPKGVHPTALCQNCAKSYSFVRLGFALKSRLPKLLKRLKRQRYKWKVWNRTPRLEAMQYKTLSAASGVAYEEARQFSLGHEHSLLCGEFFKAP